MKLDEGALQAHYDMSQSQVGEKLFLSQQAIQKIEQRAINKFKAVLKEKNINIKDLLND
jgi:DNA-directed RNA polymerase specialized sigma subunit